MHASRLLRRLILLFWSLWFSIVTASNVVDALQEARLAPGEWSFSSGNFGFIAETISIYALPSWFAGVLFLGVILIELAASVLFWMAFREAGRNPETGPSVEQRAFLAGIGLIAGFLVADEFFIVYDRMDNLESTHFIILCALLLSVVVVRSR